MSKPVLPLAISPDPDLAKIFDGYYQPIDFRQEIDAFAVRLMGLISVRFNADGLTLSSSFNSDKEAFVGTTARLFREKDQPEASLVLLENRYSSPRIQLGSSTFEKVSGLQVWGTFAVAVLAALFSIAWMVMCLVHFVQRWRGKVPATCFCTTLLWPLGSALSLFGLIGGFFYFVFIDEDLIQHLGKITPCSLCLLMVSLGALVFTVVGLLQVARLYYQKNTHKLDWYALVVLSINMMVVLYLIYWGVIPIRTWV